MADDTPDMATYWGGQQGLNWVRYQVELDACFADVTRLVLDHAALTPGQKVIDIGCGSGAHSLAAADQVGPSGEVAGLDISAPLLDAARDRAKDRPSVRFIEADGETASLPAAHFDCATSRFGVMFFDNPAVALANIASSVTPGGQIVFGVWAPVPQNPWWHVPAGLARAQLGDVPMPPPNSPGPMGLANLDYVQAQFEQAGIETLSAVTETAHLTHPGGARGAAELSVRVGAAARVLEFYEADEAARAELADALTDAYTAFETDGTLAIPAGIHILKARIG